MFHFLSLSLVFVERIFLGILEMYKSHSWACMCSAIAILCVGLGSCLYVRVSKGSSLNDIS